jgi:hypothetical protein
VTRGLLASDLPEAIRHRPKAAGGDRGAEGDRSAARLRVARRRGRGRRRVRFGRGGAGGTRRRLARRPGGSRALSEPVSRPTERSSARPSARPRIEDRLAAAGLPPLPRTAWLEIDLDALTGNLAVARALAGPGVLVEPVVKADAYGHGMIPVARALVDAGADGLCVATFDEALALRDAGVEGRVTVLYPVPAALGERAAAARVAVAAGERELLEGLLATVAEGPDGPPLDVELEIETGLGRGGVPLEEAVAAARAIAASGRARLAGVWTHFQAVEDGPRTGAQIEAVRRGARGPRRGRESPCRAATSRQREPPDARRPGLRRRPAGADDLRPAARRAGRCRARPRRR